MEKRKLSESETKRSTLHAIAYTCLAVHGMLAFGNGVLLLFLRHIGVPEARLIVYLTIPIVALAVFRAPVAIIADRFGKKRVGTVGVFVGAIGFVAISAAALVGDSAAEPAVLAGILLFSAGMVLTGAGWFALLDPIVPKNIRGRFFGNIRISWQLAGVAFSTLAAWTLHEIRGEAGFQLIFLAITFFLVARWFFYAKIPELETSSRNPVEGGFRKLFSSIMKSPGVTPFCAYVFLVMLSAAYCGRIFSLMEKEFLGLPNSRVVWLANLTMIGNLAGFHFGGKAVDKFGTRPVLVACQLSFPAVVLIYITRTFGPDHLSASLWTAHILLGVVMAAGSIAITTEMLSLTPKHNKSTATSIMISFQMAGGAFAGLACAGIVKLEALKTHWGLWGMKMNYYDTILIASAAMMLALIALIGLVPSLLGPPAWIPGEEMGK